MRPCLFKIVAIQLSLALRVSWWTIVAGSCLGASAAVLLLMAVPQRFEAAAPAAPLRAPLIALGILAGCLLFVGPVLTRRFLDPVISCEQGLRTLSGVPMIGRVPTIPTPGMKRERVRLWIKNIGLSLLSVAALVAVLVATG